MQPCSPTSLAPASHRSLSRALRLPSQMSGTVRDMSGTLCALTRQAARKHSVKTQQNQAESKRCPSRSRKGLATKLSRTRASSPVIFLPFLLLLPLSEVEKLRKRNKPSAAHECSPAPRSASRIGSSRATKATTTRKSNPCGPSTSIIGSAFLAAAGSSSIGQPRGAIACAVSQHNGEG